MGAVLVISTTLALIALIGTLIALVFIARGAGSGKEMDTYLTARDSQTAGMLALAFLASGLGSWILFAPPEVGQFLGILGVIGYAVGGALPFVAYAWLGPKIRDAAPEGVTLTDWVRQCFGRPAQAWVGLVSVFYMFMFITAELTAIGAVLDLLGGVDPWIPIVLTAGVTAAYTAWGGLPASLRTDYVQGVMILVLVAIAMAAILIHVDDPLDRARDGGLTTFSRAGWESIVVLSIAITAANLFHQGYWQRTWSAENTKVLARAGYGGALLSLLVLLPIGATGMIAGGVAIAEGVEPSPVPFFFLLDGLPEVIIFLVAVMAVALVASSVDTLQSALAAMMARDLTDRRLTLKGAKVLTVILTVPAVLIALKGYDILRLFLIADLVAAATVVPVFLGLRRPASSASVIAGSVAGLASVVVLGWIQEGTLQGGIDLLTVATSPDLDVWSFVLAPVVSGAVALAVGRVTVPSAGAGQLS
ncbi:MAG: sodium:solute symporter [Acidimicrobiales bacterium]